MKNLAFLIGFVSVVAFVFSPIVSNVLAFLALFLGVKDFILTREKTGPLLAVIFAIIVILMTLVKFLPVDCGPKADYLNGLNNMPFLITYTEGEAVALVQEELCASYVAEKAVHDDHAWYLTGMCNGKTTAVRLRERVGYFGSERLCYETYDAVGNFIQEESGCKSHVCV
ncbi:MAG: hypothetical protein ABIH34_01325 [Nanoarchaeota archaeon]